MLPNRCELVRTTCNYVVQNSHHVKINQEKLEQLADQYSVAKLFDDDHFHHTS